VVQVPWVRLQLRKNRERIALAAAQQIIVVRWMANEPEDIHSYSHF